MYYQSTNIWRMLQVLELYLQHPSNVSWLIEHVNVKSYDNKTALLKSVLKTVMDPPGGLKQLSWIYQNSCFFIASPRYIRNYFLSPASRSEEGDYFSLFHVSIRKIHCPPPQKMRTGSIWIPGSIVGLSLRGRPLMIWGGARRKTRRGKNFSPATASVKIFFPEKDYFFPEKRHQKIFFLDFLRARPQIINGRSLSKI